MDEGSEKSLILPKLSIILIGVASAALVVTIYHCIAVGWCNSRRRRQNTQNRQQQQQSFVSETQSTSIDNSTVQLIPTHKYQKGMTGLVGEDGMCPVCLSEFEEGEDLRTLPECLHSFHVACIDMWLFSHPSCPMCRADATPSPSPQIYPNLSRVTESSDTDVMEEALYLESSRMHGVVIVQSRTS